MENRTWKNILMHSKRITEDLKDLGLKMGPRIKICAAIRYKIKNWTRVKSMYEHAEYHQICGNQDQH